MDTIASFQNLDHAANYASRARRLVARLALMVAVLMAFSAPAYAGSARKGLPKPVNMGSYGTYEFRFQLWRKATSSRAANFRDWTAAQMMTELNSKFSHYFTFTGCGMKLRVGQRCNLKTIAGGAPVEVIAVSSDGFALRSLKGHPEGAGRTIRFQFQTFTNAAEISSMSLLVQAWGPLGKGSLLGPLNSNTIAKGSWNIFQNNIRDRYPTRPPGGCKTPKCITST